MKRLILVLSVLIILFTTQSLQVMATPVMPTQIVSNGEFIKNDYNPIIEKGHLFVPIRALASLGLSYSFNPTSKIATVKNKNNEYIKLTDNSKTALYNEKSIELSQPAINKNGRFLVPIRLVSEILGFNVKFDEVRNIVSIDSKDYTFKTASVNSQQNLLIARKAAISLPIVTNFNILGREGVTLQYTFPEGRADFYYYVDGPYTTFVEIKNGQAKAIGQQKIQSHPSVKKTAGNISPTISLDYDPVMNPYKEGAVVFYSIGIGNSTAIYDDVNHHSIKITNKMETYSDIIQELPDYK